MNMSEIYLNELSLEGQFNEIDEFLDAAVPMMKCLKFVAANNRQIYKHSTFYNQRITKDKTWNDLRGMRGDKVRRLKSLLLSTTDNPPFWDIQSELAQDLDAVYTYDEKDVSATSLSEAAEAKGILLSFLHKDYMNSKVPVVKNGNEVLDVPAAVSVNYLSEQLWEKEEIEVYEFLLGKYEGTRIDFSKMEKEYGFQNFEKEEIRDCLQTFEKFVRLEDWDAVFKDQGLRYKKYSPSSKEHDWFRGEQYKGKVIDKFRCINPKRCFGYRENDVFYVLRMDRTHKVSDHG